MIYMGLLALIFVYAGVFLNEKIIFNKKAFLFMAFFTMILILGLRGVHVGEDTSHYSVTLFNSFKDIKWTTVLTGFGGVKWSTWGESIELLFALLYKVVQLFTGSGQVFIFIVASLTMFLFARFIYRNINDHVFFATIIFLCDAMFMGSFNGIRQMLAVAIVVNTYDLMENKKYIKAVGLVVVAFFVHSSALVFLPVLLFHLVKNYRKGIAFVAIGASLFVLLLPLIEWIVSLIVPRYSTYFQYSYWNNSIGGVLLLWAILAVISIYLFVVGIEDKREFFGVIGAILYIAVEIIGLKYSIFSRLAYYFRIYLLMLLPLCANRIHNKSRVLYWFAMLILMSFELYSYSNVPSRQYYFFWQ